MARAKRAKKEPLEIEASSGNVFDDLGLPDAGERLAKAELARAIRKLEVLTSAGVMLWSGRRLKPMKPLARVRSGRRTVADLIGENRESNLD